PGAWGFGIGSLLAFIGAILALVYKPAMAPSMMPGQPMGSMPMGNMGSMGSMGTGAATGQMGMTCKNCGASIPAGAARCPSLGAGTIAAIVTAFGAIFLILGLLDVALGVGFLGGKGWAWILGMIVSVINIVWNLLQIGFGSYSSAFGVIIFVIIAYYLTRPHVKAF